MPPPPATLSAGVVAGVVLGSLAVAISAAVLALLLCGRLPGIYNNTTGGGGPSPPLDVQAPAKSGGWPMNVLPRLHGGYQLAGTNIGGASEEAEALRPGGGLGLRSSSHVAGADAPVGLTSGTGALSSAGAGHQGGAPQPPQPVQQHVVVSCALPEIDASDLAQASEIGHAKQIVGAHSRS